MTEKLMHGSHYHSRFSRRENNYERWNTRKMGKDIQRNEKEYEYRIDDESIPLQMLRMRLADRKPRDTI